jgi:hypothetical protein
MGGEDSYKPLKVNLILSDFKQSQMFSKNIKTIVRDKKNIY